jgi:Leucine-rich repeat (LRR) protein
VNLRKLDCSFNQLTSLDLSSCSNLTHFNCSSNELTSIDFLYQLPNKEKLEVLRISENKNFEANLDSLVSFVGMNELNVENCKFHGSLEALKNIKNLKKIFISHTLIDKGLEYLPERLEMIYCEKTKLVEGLDGYEKKDRRGTYYYDYQS